MAGTEGKSNLSFVLHKPFEVTFEERPVPELNNDTDTLIAVNYTGICGSDVHYWEEGRVGSFILKNPMVLGHESAGTVVKVGAGVTTLKPGDRVAVEPGRPCRNCKPCLSGFYNLCIRMKFAASPPVNGTLTGFYVVPSDFCYKLPDHVSTQEGALFEPLAVAVHVVKQAEVKPGSSVVVMGAGPVGLLCMAVAKAFGADVIVGVDVQDHRLEFAKGYAATHVFKPERVPAEENAARLLKETGLDAALDANRGADCVIDASGVEPSIQTCLHVVRKGGVYVQAGMGKPDITFPIMALCMKEVTAKGSFRYSSGDYELALALVSSGKIDVKSLITKTVKFTDAENAFKSMKDGTAIKVLIAGPNEA